MLLIFFVEWDEAMVGSGGAQDCQSFLEFAFALLSSPPRDEADDTKRDQDRCTNTGTDADFDGIAHGGRVALVDANGRGQCDALTVGTAGRGGAVVAATPGAVRTLVDGRFLGGGASLLSSR
jgi:hypothetical protein